MEEFVMLQCNFADLKHSEDLRGPSLTDAKILQFLQNSYEIIRKKIFDFAPIDKKGIALLAEKNAAGIGSIPDFISLLPTFKPSNLESEALPFCRDDRNPEKVIEKKLSPVTDIAVDYRICLLFEKLFPPNPKTAGKPSKKEFRFTSNYKGWVVIRKVNLEIAENKEVLACLVHTMEGLHRRFAQFHPNPAYFARLDALLSKYPQRKSFGKLILALNEAQKEGLLSQQDAFLNKYGLYRILWQLGYSPYLSGELLEGIYPELKIPKPRGRLKKD